jgi:hypothetical protein
MHGHAKARSHAAAQLTGSDAQDFFLTDIG